MPSRSSGDLQTCDALAIRRMRAIGGVADIGGNRELRGQQPIAVIARRAQRRVNFEMHMRIAAGITTGHNGIIRLPALSVTPTARR